LGIRALVFAHYSGFPRSPNRSLKGQRSELHRSSRVQAEAWPSSSVAP